MNCLNLPRGAWLGLVGLLALTVGCGGSEYGDLGTVSGTVTLDGQPYPNAQVTFNPETGRPSIGITDAQGKYELTYIRNIRGAVPGSHTVRINTVHESLSDNEGPEIPDEPIPPKYNTRTELVERVDVGENMIDFDLQSK